MSAISYTPDETVRDGQERYEQEIRSRVEGEPGNRGKMLALDIESGEYVIGIDSLTALDGLQSRRPDAVVYMVRVGYPTAVKIGVGRKMSVGTSTR